MIQELLQKYYKQLTADFLHARYMYTFFSCFIGPRRNNTKNNSNFIPVGAYELKNKIISIVEGVQ